MPHVASRFTRLLTVLIALTAGVLLTPSAARAASSPAITLHVAAPAQVLYGTPATVTLTAADPQGQPTGYNLTFRDVLPAGISYVPGSSSVGGASVTPRVLTNAPTAGKTTLIWSNVSDLSPSSSAQLTYAVSASTVSHAVLDSYTEQQAAYVNTDPRTVPAFDPTTGNSVTTSATGTATASSTTQLSALQVTSSDDAGDELLRGVHDHQTVYTVDVTNNSVASTTSATLDTYLPAGLEFLGCGQQDHTTDTLTNPGSAAEYAGAGSLGGHLSSPAGCGAPTEVQTGTFTPGTLSTGVYTHVQWSLGTLAAGQTVTLRFVAAVPLLENEDVWPGGKPTDASGDQGSNLDNNQGDETFDGQSLPTFSTASGEYGGTLGVSAGDTTTVVAKNIILTESVDHPQIAVGSQDLWSLDVQAGEYKYLEALQISATLPDGVCPVDSPDGNLTSSAECAPDGRAPSSEFTGVHENGDGTWSLAWDQSTDLDLTQLAPNASTTITVPVAVRSHYGNSSAPTGPILAGDSWTGTSQASGDQFARCASADPTCTLGHPQIFDTETQGVSVSATSSAVQSVSQPVIAKSIDSRASTPLDCATDTYVDTAPTYHPGDKVCFKLHIDFPSATDTGGAQITDFLPPGTTYDTGSLQATPSDTVSIGTVDSTTNPGVLSIPLGSSGAVDKAEVLDAVYSVTIVDPTKANQGDVEGNLMKFANTDTGGTSFPQRAQANYTFAKALLSTTEGVYQVNGAPAGGHAANTDGLAVGGGDLVTVRVDVTNNVTNSGGLDASAVGVTEDLPGQLTCAATSAVSDGGSCVAGSPDTIQWAGLSVPAGQTKTVFYTYAVPHGQLSGITLNSHAGVVSYQTPTDTGTPFTNIPANNIDSAAGAANTAAADDTTDTVLATPTFAMSDTTSVTGETGNNASQATIGERIDETATMTLPGGVAEGSTTQFSATIPSRLTYVPGTVSATLNGAALPVGWTVGESGGQITLTAPDGYEPTATATVLVQWSATVNDSNANTRTGSIAQPATFQYDAVTGSVVTLNGSVSNAVVEPNLHASLSSNASGLVDPGQALAYTATLTNTSATGVSTANHLTASVTVPAGETPVDAGGHPVADGGTVAGSGAGVWSQTTRTITFPITATTQLVSGGSSSFVYDVTVDAAQPSSSTLVGHLSATALSLESPATAPGTARTATTAAALAPPVSGYSATASSTITLVDATVAKAVSVTSSTCSQQSSCDATIGDPAVYTLQVTIPSGIALNDALVRDTVPDGVAYDGLLSAQCSAGCTLPADIPVSEIPAQPNGDGTTTLGFWLGEVGSSAQARTVTITYAGHVRATHHDTTSVVDGQTLAGAATVDDNQTQTLPSSTPASIPATSAYSYISPSSAATLDVTEPSVAISTAVTDSDGIASHVDPGDDLTFTITVTNNGDSTAYQVPVTDVPDTHLVIDGDEASLAGGGDLTQQWTSTNGASTWLIGSLGAHQSVTLRYTATLVASAQLSNGTSLTDTATLGSYAGVSPSDQSANPAFTYRIYSGATAPQTLTVELPALSVANTTGVAGFPETAHAQVGQAFDWRVAVTNTSTEVPARGTVLSYTLPANWHYVAGSAGSAGDPQITSGAGGDTLTWQLHAVAGGATVAIPFKATPSLDAETDPGSGAGHINQTSASTTWTDGSGASGSHDGAYAAGPDAAGAQLDIPALTIAATPDAGAFTAGQTGTWSIVVHNGGAAPAHNVLVSDAIPDGDPYAAGDATASPSSGFSETQDTTAGGATHLQWTIDSLAAGDSVTITVPTAPPASTPDATAFSTPVSAVADEVPAAVTDGADATVHTSADVGVTDTVSPSPAAPGTSVVYTLTATDHGPSDAQDVTLTDTLDSSETFDSFTAGGADCTQSGQQITCQWATVAAGDSHQIKVRVTLHADATGTVLNHSAITTTTPDSITADDQADAPVGTSGSSDLSITDSADVAQVLEGGTFHLTLAITNHGPSDAAGVLVSDQLPAGVSFVSADSGCTAAANLVSCAVGPLAAGADRSFEITVQAGSAQTVTDAAGVSSTTTDSDPTNNSAAATVQIDHAADLSVAVAAPATTAPDADVTYTLTAADHGPSDATGALVTDTLPAGMTFVSASSGAGSCTNSDQTITCAIGALANGGQTTITIVAHAQFPAAGQTLTDNASIAGDQGDPVASNNDDSAATTVGPAAGMAITDQVDNPAPGQQQQVTYTLTYSDHGPTSAHGIVVTDTLPAGVTFVSSDDPNCTQNIGVVTCSEPALDAGGAGVIHVVVSTGTVGLQQDAVSVSATEPDPDPSDNRASAPLTVAPTANLTLQTTTSTPDVPAGGVADYTLAVTNHGPSDAHDVTITVPLTAGAQLVGAAIGDGGSCTPSGSVLVCTIPFLAAGDTVSAEVQVRPGLGLAGTTLLGSATVGAREGNAGSTVTTSGSVTMTVGPAADTSVAVSMPARVPAGASLLTTLTVRNHGPQASTGTTVTATLPAGVTFVSARTPDGHCSANGHTLVCRLGRLAPGVVRSIAVTATVTADAPATLSATARVTADQPDPKTPNNQSKASTRVVAPAASAHLQVSESESAKAIVLGHRVGYTITVANHSRVAATGVVALDRPSGSERVLSVRTPVGSCDGLRCELGRLAPGRSVQIHVVVEPMRTGALRHQAMVTSDHGSGTQPARPVLVNVRMAQTHLAVAVTARHHAAVAGGAMTYLLSVRNAGHATADGVILCDTPSAAMTFVAVHGARFQDGRPCWTIPLLAAGAVAHRHVTVRFVGSANGRILDHDSVVAHNAARRDAVAAVNVSRRASVRSSEGVTG